jgi:hypothetical protein
MDLRRLGRRQLVLSSIRKMPDHPIKLWSAEMGASCYPPKEEPYAPTETPPRPSGWSEKYLRPSLAKNERLRLSMLWYHTRDILHDTEFLSGLQEKACFAQESTGWEFAVIGIQDVNFYIRLATVGLQLGILPRGETICAHTVTQPPSVSRLSITRTQNLLNPITRVCF